MTKYYIDTEFIEGPHDKTFMGFKYGQTKPTIDLISIGIVAEDGREYYAISKDFNLKEAWNRWQPRTEQGDRNNTQPKEYWIRENVLRPIFKDLWWAKCHMVNLHHISNDFTYKNFERLIQLYGKSNQQIAEEVEDFIRSGTYGGEFEFVQPKFYAYYADYDWVAFCWLFGRMMDLPKAFPKYCRDLKQMLDEMYMYQANKYEDLTRLEAWLMDSKKHPLFPKQENEHNALADAQWNKKLHAFMQYVKKHDFVLPDTSCTSANPDLS